MIFVHHFQDILFLCTVRNRLLKLVQFMLVNFILQKFGSSAVYINIEKLFYLLYKDELFLYVKKIYLKNTI